MTNYIKWSIISTEGKNIRSFKIACFFKFLKLKNLITLNYACVIVCIYKKEDNIYTIIVERENGEKRFPAGVVSFEDIIISLQNIEKDNSCLKEILDFILLKQKEFLLHRAGISNTKENSFLNEKLKSIFLFLKKKKVNVSKILEKSIRNTLRRTIFDETEKYIEEKECYLVETYKKGPHYRYLYVVLFENMDVNKIFIPQRGEVVKAYPVEMNKILVFLSKKHHEYYKDISQWLSYKI